MPKVRAIHTKTKASNSGGAGLPESVKSTLKRKLDSYKKKYPQKADISIEELKKVYQKGSPKDSRLNAFAIARVNKFLEKHAQKHIKENIDKEFAAGGMVAPNGKPSNLSPEQYKLVRTPEFKAWFGDWENVRANASKVVDMNGEPLVVWHTTNEDFFVFNKKKSREGFYFSPEKARLEVYNKSKLFPFFLNIKNPSHEIGEMYSKALVEKGYDGIMDYGHAKKINEYLYEIIAFESNQIKLADGSNTTFDASNPDIRYEDGGNIELEDLKNDLTISDIDNKYPNVTHEYINQQLIKGIQAELEHTDNPEVAKKIALDHLNENIQYYEYLNKMESEMASQSEIDQHFEEIYKKGGETDIKRIPSTDKSTWDAKFKKGDTVKIRIDMVGANGIDYNSPENSFQIEKVENPFSGAMRPENPSGILYILSNHGGSWEGKDLEYADESRNSVKPDLGFDPIFSFKTPTGERTRLNYIQQVLVRTSKFKAFFGDWEMAARSFIADGKNNFDRHFEDISKIVDSVTLEPRVVFHGTMSEKEFFNFDVTREKGIGRPYAYFAFNKEYSQNFTTGSQRGDNDGKAILYNVFLNVRHPFYALGPQFENVKEDAEHWIEVITDRIYYDKYKKTQKDEFHSALKSTIYGQVGRYVTKAFPNDIKEKFWRLMSYDADKEFKYFLIAYGYDGVIYDEEFTSQYDINDSGLYTKAVTVFDARQIKLADGRNTEFNPMTSDIRYDDGGKVTEGQSSEHITENHNTMNKKEQLEKLMFGGPTGIFKDGGKVKGDGNLDHDAKDGGFFVGQSHADGGIKAVNKDTGQIIEVEGNEVIINKRSVADTTKREFEGEMLTNREILSRINEAGGGVKFEDGGPLSCCGKKYKFGGETKEDFTIVYEISQTKDGHTLAHEYLKEVYK